MTDLIAKIERYNFECQAGPLALCEDWIALKAQIERLRARLLPFAAVAKGIPGEWPGDCHLSVVYGEGHGEYLSYVMRGVESTLPTIAEWREAAKAGGSDA